jgi:membrane protein DedA with SNARE-associated domain
VPLILAAITDQLATFATNVVNDIGIPGIFVLMLLESACIPIPSEATMLFAGFSVSEGHYSLFAVTAAGVLGNLAGSWIAYAVGWFGRVEVLERRLRIKRVHLEQADRWFERWGDWAVFFSRMLPIVRTFISLPAGVARMPFWRFTILTLVGCIPWVFALALIGKQVGSRWTQWKDSLHYVDYAVAVLILAAVAYYGARWWRARRARPADAPSS